MGCYISKEEQNNNEIVFSKHKTISCRKCCDNNDYSFEFINDNEVNNSFNKENKNNKDIDEKQNKFKKFKYDEKMKPTTSNNDKKENNEKENSNDFNDINSNKLEDNNEIKSISEKKENDDSITSNIVFTNSEFKFSINDNDEFSSLGINIGSLKTVYSIFSKINGKCIFNVLLMNNSSRIIPSILCYTKTHRLFGENSFSSLSQNLDSSYNNLSRLIGFNNNIEIYKDEIIYSFFNNNNEYKFNYKDSDGLKEINVETIITDFLILINKYYFKTENYKYSSTNISVPDYYTSYQKDLIKLMCKSLNMNEVNIFNESSAITMYYGYTKYRDNFVYEKNKVDKTITKFILFIDSGHSKTSFILSKFKYNEFKVLYVSTLTNVGGRNFDELIFKYCINEFIANNNLSINEINLSSKYLKMKFRLIEAIKKARIQLTVNTESMIKVDSFYKNLDLEVRLTKEQFEELIKDYIEEINEYLNNVILYASENNVTVDCVEIAGELMRTPILQKIIEDKKISISKSLLIDECTSVGSSILGYYIKGKLPIEPFQYFIHYNYYRICYIIIDENTNNEKFNLIDIGFIHENEIKIKIQLNLKFFNKRKNIHIQFFYDNEKNNNINKYLNNLLLVEYEIDLFKIYQDNVEIIENENYIYFNVKIDEAQKIIEPHITFNNNILKATINVIQGGIYKNEKEENKFKKKIYKILKNHKSYDLVYDIFIEEKNEISKKIYDIKSTIENNEEFKDQFEKIKNLDKKYHNNKSTNNEFLINTKNELKEISLEIIDKLLKENIEDQNIQILQQMKNNLIQDSNNFNFKEFINFLSNFEIKNS